MNSVNKGTRGPKCVSAENVLEAAEALQKSTGKTPTVEEVRREVGSGSPSRIVEIVRAWRTSVEPAMPLTATNDQVAKTLKALTGIVCADFTRRYQVRIDRRTADNSSFQEEMGRLEENAISRQEELTHTLAERDSLAAKGGADEVHRLRLELVQEKSDTSLLEQDGHSLLDRSAKSDQERNAAGERIIEPTDERARTRADRDSLAAQLEDAIVQLAESEHRPRVQPRRPLVALRRSASTPVSPRSIGRTNSRLRSVATEIPMAKKGAIE